MKASCEILFAGGRLGRKEAADLLGQITSGTVPPALCAAFLTIFRMRSPTVDELLGFRDALVSRSTPISTGDPRIDDLPIFDLCGTGGDSKDTFNISTAAAFALAATGKVRVAKHGNYGFSSSCGSSNVIEALGIPLHSDAEAIRNDLERYGLAFIHAPAFHPALKAVASIRRELGFRTVLNLLGPLLNPSSPTHQIIGVPTLEIARLLSAVCRELPGEYRVVHTLDGYDEVSLTDVTRVFSRTGECDLEAGNFNLRSVRAAELKGGSDAKASADILEAILEGRGSVAQRSVTVANAALALTSLDGMNLSAAVETVQSALDSKRAYKLLNDIRKQ